MEIRKKKVQKVNAFFLNFLQWEVKSQPFCISAKSFPPTQPYKYKLPQKINMVNEHLYTVQNITQETHTPDVWLMHTMYPRLCKQHSRLSVEKWLVLLNSRVLLLCFCFFYSAGDGTQDLANASPLPLSYLPNSWGLLTAYTFNALKYTVNY